MESDYDDDDYEEDDNCLYDLDETELLKNKNNNQEYEYIEDEAEDYVNGYYNTDNTAEREGEESFYNMEPFEDVSTTGE